jgi:hypothetical protein
MLCSLIYRPLHLLGILVGGMLLMMSGRVIAQDIPNVPAAEITQDYTSAAYQKTFNQHVAQGKRLLHISITNQGSQVCYKAIWSATDGPLWAARHGMTDMQFQSQLDNYTAQGYRPVDLCAYMLGATPFFGGLWEMSDGPDWEVHKNLSPADFATEDKSLTVQGYHLAQSYKYTTDGKPLILGFWQK